MYFFSLHKKTIYIYFYTCYLIERDQLNLYFVKILSLFQKWKLFVYFCVVIYVLGKKNL